MPLDSEKTSVQPTMPVSVTSGQKPQAQEILGGLKTGSQSPLDFIRNNLKNAPESPPIDAQKISDDTKLKLEEPTPDLNLSGSSEEAPKATDLKLQESPLPEPDEFSDEPQADSISENYKKLKSKFKETKASLKAKEEEATTFKTKLEKYETGAVIPEVLQEKENEIARLSKYEKLVNFKSSAEYQEKYVKPLLNVETRLKDIAKDYEIPEDVLSQALDITNKAELNRFLGEHFDDIGALEVKQLIVQAQDLKKEGVLAEKEPEKNLILITAEQKRATELRKAKSREIIADNSRGAWEESLFDIREEGNIKELIVQSDNLEHHERIVKPILTAAATEYGKIVRMLADEGLESLPKDLAKVLAKSVLLAHASAVALQTREAALTHARELEQNSARLNGYMRPPVGTAKGQGGAPAPSGAKHSSPAEAARAITQQVLSRTHG